MTLAPTRPAGARLTREQATVLARYAGGDSATTIAAATGLGLDVVGQILDELAGNNRDLARKLVHEHTEYVQSVAAAKGGVPAPRPTPGPAPTPAPVAADPIARLLKQAASSGDPRMQKTASRIADLIRQLRADMAEHARLAGLRTEIAQLEERMAELKTQLRTSRTASPAGTDSTSASRTPAAADPGAQFRAAVRTWAQQAGVPCSATGRLSAAVLDAYQAAHPDTNPAGTDTEATR
ncbi:Lsr2 family DNA-binding protein [Actinoplanes siamensis]|uniref:Lsr2 DNA-binding domain-containing protein n=1 Tax=Actinoplanes siamensis TaxID=1223317 RepID=A0A919NDE8_9ACTN|nr:histone-like nucleoid-structuring protein Lsr2 [Actinoplanes siamensis]GIF08868.1 hypothetical protein Asi03nite_64060 [Actinoplanes siamensis]